MATVKQTIVAVQEKIYESKDINAINTVVDQLIADYEAKDDPVYELAASMRLIVVRLLRKIYALYNVPAAFQEPQKAPMHELAKTMQLIFNQLKEPAIKFTEEEVREFMPKKSAVTDI